MVQQLSTNQGLSRMIILAVVLTPVVSPGEPDSAQTSTSIARHALLVGCTKYPNAPNVPELWGPANDVPAMAELLTQRFGFPEQNIRRLAGWPDDPAARPTCANIVAAFEELIRSARPNSQIVVLMTGHGTQTPIPESQQSVLDPVNPEHDGMDEVFLPADFSGWKNGGLENAIVDDQMGEWLDQLKLRGARVWIIFDCCHSGTMTRDAGTIERHRGVKPSAIGVPEAALQSVASKLRNTAEHSRSVVVAEADILDLSPTSTGTGSVTAFYAAQAFETAPELPRPSDAPRTPENYFGLLTYVMIQTLESQGDSMTYRDLGRRVISRYRAERGSKSPTPFFSGDLDREVLGLSVFPERSSIVLERDGRIARVSAGEFMGITPGSILAVYPPNDREHEEHAILGYVRATKVTPGHSEIEGCEYNETSAVALANFPNLAKCRIVWQQLGDMRLKLAVWPSDDLETSGVHDSLLNAAIDVLPQEIASLVDHVADWREAQWLLKAVEPAESLEVFGHRVHNPVGLLIKAGALDKRTDSIAGSRTVVKPKVFGQYPLNDPAVTAQRMQIDLQKLFSWQNTWRIAELATAERSRSSGTLRLEVSRVNANGEASSDETPGTTLFVPGDNLRVRVVNDSTQDMWVTLLYLDANFGISVWLSEALKAGKSFTDGGTIDESSIGPEGFIVLSIPVRGQKSQPSYEFLEQDGLGVTTRAVRQRPSRILNPFEKLMTAAAFGKGKHRGLRRKSSATPQILSWSWVTRSVATSK